MGGYLTPPFFVTDRDEPYRPGLAIWMDAREGLVVGQAVVAPEDREGAVARVLRAAMKRPLAGPPRRPGRVRVSDPTLVAEVHEIVGAGTPIEVAPTPELDELLDSMLEFMPGDDEDASYLEGGRIAPDAMAGLFQAAARLYKLAPWNFASEDRPLRMDIPALDVEGACVVVIGSLGEQPGLVIFPSLDAYDAFLRAGEIMGEREPGSGPVDFGSECLALTFDRGADLPGRMRREVAEHGWTVAGAKAYPSIEHRERDCALRPLDPRELEIARVCAASFASLFRAHREIFEADEPEPLCETRTSDRGVEVRWTLPYEAFSDAALSQPAAAGPRVGRNDPCPCGSGRKYKKCHLGADEAARQSDSGPSRYHDLDRELVDRLGDHAMQRFPDEWPGFAEDFDDFDESIQLAGPWSLYHYRVQGRSVADWYLEARGRRLSAAERGWLASQQAAWLSVWEVTAVEPGRSLTLRDLLSHEERVVQEASASRELAVRSALLARVVDHAGVSLLCGVHPRSLPPFDAAEVVRRARGRLRRKRAVPVERLRDEAFGRYLIGRWEDAVFAAERAAETPRELTNTDGDPILFITDHFRVAPADRAEVAARVAGIEGANEEGGEEGNGGATDFVFLAPGNPVHASWPNTVIGKAILSGAALRLQTNSRERADALRQKVEAACGDLVRHRAREHADPLSEAAPDTAAGAAPEPPPEAQQLLLEFKRSHYADWVDHSLPALGGKTPREVVRTARGREAVDLLLKDMENMEQRSPAGSRYDFGEIRRQLGLE